MRPLFNSSAGIAYLWGDEGDHKVIKAVQDADPILDRNKAMATHNDGYSPSRELRRVASIPAIVRLKWLNEEGWDCFSGDPDCQRRLRLKLNSSDWAHLRTAPGVI